MLKTAKNTSGIKQSTCITRVKGYLVFQSLSLTIGVASQKDKYNRLIGWTIVDRETGHFSTFHSVGLPIRCTVQLSTLSILTPYIQITSESFPHLPDYTVQSQWNRTKSCKTCMLGYWSAIPTARPSSSQFSNRPDRLSPIYNLFWMNNISWNTHPLRKQNQHNSCDRIWHSVLLPSPFLR